MQGIRSKIIVDEQTRSILPLLNLEASVRSRSSPAPYLLCAARPHRSLQILPGSEVRFPEVRSNVRPCARPRLPLAPGHCIRRGAARRTATHRDAPPRREQTTSSITEPKDMNTSDRGLKHVCLKCTSKYYDMRMEIIACPNCGAKPRAARVTKTAPPARKSGRSMPRRYP